MQSRIVVITLLPDSVTLYAAGRRKARTIPFGSGGANMELDKWFAALRLAAPSLEKAAAELGLKGARARVLYVSPTQVVEQVSVKSRSSADAEQAALLAGTDSLPYDAAEATSRAVYLACDDARKSAKGGRTVSSAEPARRHYVVMSDRDDVAAAMVDCVEAAGLRYQSATPIDAALLAHVVGAALAQTTAPRGMLYLGRHCSFFVLASPPGVLRFGRRISLGLETILSSLMLPIRQPGGETIELTREQARTLIHKHGIPAQGAGKGSDPLNAKGSDPFSTPHSLSANQVMPLLQPVLQRLIVELRQSLRYGIEEEDRRALSITLLGPGGAIPGLSDLLHAELEVPVEVSSACRQDHPEEGELVDACRSERFLKIADLLPRRLAHERHVARVRRWLWTGTSAALVLLGVDYTNQGRKLADVRAEAALVAGEQAELHSLSATRDRIVTAMNAANDLSRRVELEMSDHANLRAVLQDLGRLTPGSIRLTAVSMRRTPNGVTGQVAGYKFEGAEATSSLSLDGYVERLQASPLLHRVVLRNVQIATVDGRQVQQFDLGFAVHPAPAQSLLDQSLVSAGPEASR